MWTGEAPDDSREVRNGVSVPFSEGVQVGDGNWQFNQWINNYSLNQPSQEAPFGELIEVGVFTPAEAATFVRRRLAEYPSFTDDVDGVTADLGRLPLALSHATAFMADRRMTCADYRHVFADRERRLAALFPEAEALPDQYERTVAVTWSLSVDAANELMPTGLARPFWNSRAFWIQTVSLRTCSLRRLPVTGSPMPK